MEIVSSQIFAKCNLMLQNMLKEQQKTNECWKRVERRSLSKKFEDRFEETQALISSMRKFCLKDEIAPKDVDNETSKCAQEVTSNPISDRIDDRMDVFDPVSNSESERTESKADSMNISDSITDPMSSFPPSLVSLVQGNKEGGNDEHLFFNDVDSRTNLFKEGGNDGFKTTTSIIPKRIQNMWLNETLIDELRNQDQSSYFANHKLKPMPSFFPNNLEMNELPSLQIYFGQLKFIYGPFKLKTSIQAVFVDLFFFLSEAASLAHKLHEYPRQPSLWTHLSSSSVKVSNQPKLDHMKHQKACECKGIVGARWDEHSSFVALQNACGMWKEEEKGAAAFVDHFDLHFTPKCMFGREL